MNKVVRAIALGNLAIWLQPIEPIAGVLKPDYFEVLLRVKNDTGEHDSPVSFLEMLTEVEALRLDCWVFEQVEQLPKGRRYAVNFCGRSLANPAFIRLIGRSTQTLALEITEHDPLTRSNQDVLRQLCQQFYVVLDDIGSAYSGLNRLLSFEFSGVKIDGALVCQVGTNAKARAILCGLMRTIEEIGLSCVLEHVETREILGLLKELKALCAPSLNAYVQGWEIGRPRPLNLDDPACTSIACSSPAQGTLG